MASASRQLSLEYEIPAPLAEVWHGWTEPHALQSWYENPGRPGPERSASVELRVGGFWRVFMDVDDDNRYWTGGRYLEIVPFERLVWAWGAVDGWPKITNEPADGESVATLELSGSLSEGSGPTRMVSSVVFGSSIPDDWVPLCRRGWTDTLDRFEVRPTFF